MNLDFKLSILSDDTHKVFVASKLKQLMEGCKIVLHKVENGETTTNDDWSKMNDPMNEILDILYTDIAYRN